MANFENEYSKFPEKRITLNKFQNVTDDIAEVINQINVLRGQGLYNQANRYIQNNKDVLSKYCPDAITINTIIEEIYNTQIYAKQKQQCIYFDEEEPLALYSDVWIGGN